MPKESREGEGPAQGKVHRFFRNFGVPLADQGDQLAGTCPFCGKDRFAADPGSGQWDCKVCQRAGNPLTFVRQLWEESDAATSDYSDLAADRKLLFPETLMSWSVARSIVGGRHPWLAAGFDPRGKVCQVYRYDVPPGGRKPALLACDKSLVGAGSGMFGMGLWNPKKPEVWVCEGLWDAAALWEVLRTTKVGEDGSLLPTASEASSLLASANVVGIPGAGNFHESWGVLCKDRDVVLLFDNDHAKTMPDGRKVTGAGLAGAQRVSLRLASTAEHRPRSIRWVCWGDGGWDAALPSGWDVRDQLTSRGADAASRRAALKGLLDKVVPIPEAWVGGRTKDGALAGSAEIECVECRSWKVLRASWQEAMKWSAGLDRALAVMLASVLSTKALGDQLWVKIVSPPSTGKSVLCEALAVNRRHVVAKSTMRGFHSGFKSDPKGEEDNSLLAQIRDKTLVTKDGDTLLQSPNLGQILSEARDVYDRTSRTHYRNKTSRTYENLDMTWILCGTSSLRALDSSELGERFLDCIIMDKIDDEVEDDILYRVACKAARNVSSVSNGTVESNHDPDMLRAMQLTGGYVDWLRDNAEELLAKVEKPEEALRRCIVLGKFVAYLRARPSKGQDEVVEREFGARLVSQIIRLACCLAVVTNKRSMGDPAVMAWVKAVAMDTARGKTLSLTERLHKAGRAEGLTAGALAVQAVDAEDKQRSLLSFLSRIGAVERIPKEELPADKRSHVRWRLTKVLDKIMTEVQKDA